MKLLSCLLFYSSLLLSLESDLSNLLYNRVEIPVLGHRIQHRLHPKSKIIDTKLHSSYNGEAHRLIGRDKKSNFSYSLSYTKYGNGKIENMIESISDGKTPEGRPKYKTQYFFFSRDGQLKSHTECKGNLDKGKIEEFPARLRSGNASQIYLDYKCNSLSPDVCRSHDQITTTAKSINDPHYLNSRIQSYISEDSSFRSLHLQNMRQIKQATPPGGRSNLLWPKDPLKHAYAGMRPEESITDEDIEWLNSSCEKLATHLVTPELGNAARIYYAIEEARVIEAENKLFQQKVNRKQLRKQMGAGGMER